MDGGASIPRGAGEAVPGLVVHARAPRAARLTRRSGRAGRAGINVRGEASQGVRSAKGSRAMREVGGVGWTFSKFLCCSLSRCSILIGDSLSAAYIKHGPAVPNTGMYS